MISCVQNSLPNLNITLTVRFSYHLFFLHQYTILHCTQNPLALLISLVCQIQI